MKTHRIGALAGLTLLAGLGTAAAQTVVVTPDQQTVIHEYIVQHDVAPVQLPSDTTVSVGATIPQDVQLIQVPDVDQYRYVVVNGQTLVVDPQSRKIVQILQ